MNYTITITDTSTGESVQAPWEAAHPFEDEFQWSEGNSSCDCNRWLMFMRAKGDPRPVSDAQCSDGRFLVSIADESGAVVYEEATAQPD